MFGHYKKASLIVMSERLLTVVNQSLPMSAQIDLLLSHLLKLLNQDKEALKRRVTEATTKYPDQTAEWYVKKVIWDIEGQELSSSVTKVRKAKPSPPPPPPAKQEPPAEEPLYFQPPGRKPAQRIKVTPELMALVKHEPTAQRLLDAAQLNNPGKNAKWVIDKVIWDLERDRI
jgi:hypothetical protein